MSRKMYVVLVVLAVVFYVGYAKIGIAQNSSPFFCKEGETRPCGVGACRGVTKCIGGVWSDNCEGAASPVPEICDNNIDDDCNGIVDDCGDETLTFLSYIMIISGVALFVFAVVLSRIQARRMREQEGNEENEDLL